MGISGSIGGDWIVNHDIASVIAGQTQGCVEVILAMQSTWQEPNVQPFAFDDIWHCIACRFRGRVSGGILGSNPHSSDLGTLLRNQGNAFCSRVPCTYTFCSDTGLGQVLSSVRVERDCTIVICHNPHIPITDPCRESGYGSGVCAKIGSRFGCLVYCRSGDEQFRQTLVGDQGAAPLRLDARIALDSRPRWLNSKSHSREKLSCQYGRSGLRVQCDASCSFPCG